GREGGQGQWGRGGAGLDEQLVQLGRVLTARLRLELASLRPQLAGTEAAGAAAGGLERWRLPATAWRGPPVRSADGDLAAVLPLEDGSVGGRGDQEVGNGRRGGAGDQEQATVEQGERQPHGAPRQPRAGGESGEPAKVHGHPQIR